MIRPVDNRELPRGRPQQSSEAAKPAATVDEENAPPSRPSVFRGTIASFGAFRLHAAERVLEKDGMPVKIGGRAFDILLMLLEHAPEIVSKRDLIRRAWGALVVDDVSLRVHVAALRRYLGDGEPSGAHITNVPGRGYCFVGEVTWLAGRGVASSVPAAASGLPREPLLMVGRDPVIRELIARLQTQRFVSIVGAGGIGKTTIALALAHRLFAEFQGAVHFLDLAPIDDPRLLPSVLASQLGLLSIADQQLPILLASLVHQRMLLVFDSCEHLIESA